MSSMMAPSCETIPSPALPAPVMVSRSNRKFRKLPQASEPNCTALFSVDRLVVSWTLTFWLTIVTSLARRLVQRFSDRILSPTLRGASPVTRPSPSKVPVPVMDRFAMRSPHSKALRKWLCPKSWNSSNAFGSGASMPLDEATIVDPALSWSVMLVLRWMLRDRYLPDGKTTVPPPPALAAALIARSIASSSNVEPLPVAPKFRTLNMPGPAWAAGPGRPATAPAATKASAQRDAARQLIRILSLRTFRPVGRCDDSAGSIEERHGKGTGGRQRRWSMCFARRKRRVTRHTSATARSHPPDRRVVRYHR